MNELIKLLIARSKDRLERLIKLAAPKLIIARERKHMKKLKRYEKQN